MEVVSGADGVPDGHIVTRIGSGSDNSGPTAVSAFSGDIAEVLIFDRVLTDQEQFDVEDYLHARHLTSGGTAGSLSVTDGLVLRLDASNVTLKDPEPLEPITRVTEWTDLSGRFNHAAQSIYAHEFPRLVTGVTRMGGDAVTFNGVTEFLEIPGNATDFDGPEHTWYAVFRPGALDGGRLLNSGYADLNPDSEEFVTNYAAWGSMTGSNGRFRVQGRTASNGFASANISDVVTMDEFLIGGGRWDSTTGELMAIALNSQGQRNSEVSENVGAVPTLHVFTRIGTGAGTTSGNPNAYYTGDIAEILIYNRLLTEEEQLAVESYLYDKHFGDVPLSGYEAWVLAHFSAADQENPAVSGPDANPAGDGISNHFKYAFGLSPWSDGRSGLPAAEIVEDALILTYRRLKDAPDLAYTVEVSPDMTNWQSGPDHIEETQVLDVGDVDEVTAMAVHYPGSWPRGFMRLRIEPIEN